LIEVKMKKIIERLLIFFIGIPAVILIVLYLPFYRNLAVNLIVIFFSGMGAVEFSNMLEKKQIKISKIESFILGALLPIVMTLYVSFNFSALWVSSLISAGIIWAFLSKIFPRQTEIESITGRITGCFSLIVYPGFFMCWMVLMGIWEFPAAVLLFLFITFGSDSLAWLFGSLFGANNRGLITVSPNKSIAGFIGGLLGSVLVAIGAVLIFPDIFNIQGSSSIIIAAVILGLFTGIAAILGDLAESAIKRSCDFKDSGNFMLGRGGVLDCLDSIAVAAPVFFFLFTLFFR